MTMELSINGYFNMTICLLGTEVPVENEVGQGVLDNLQQCEYVIEIRTRTISDINDLSTPLYSFIIEATCSSEYEFFEKN